jgi:hypothetical protein
MKSSRLLRVYIEIQMREPCSSWLSIVGNTEDSELFVILDSAHVPTSQDSC